MNRNNLPFTCRQCPSGEFELTRIAQGNFGPARFMAICHAKEVILHPEFNTTKVSETLVISKANVGSVIFHPVENCPHIETMIREKKISWATASIDFSPRSYEYKKVNHKTT